MLRYDAKQYPFYSVDAIKGETDEAENNLPAKRKSSILQNM